MKVLVAEKDGVLRGLLGDCVAGLGHNVVNAADGAALVELALAERPDLIIADMYMDETGGVPAPVALEMYPDLAVIPVILIASAADPELSAVGPLNGVPVLVKPFASDRLAAEIEKAAKKTGRETQR